MLKKIIFGMLIMLCGFLIFSQLDKILGYPFAVKSFEHVLEDYGKNSLKNCEGVTLGEKDNSLYILSLDIKKGTSKYIIELLEESNKKKIEIEISAGGILMESLYLGNYIHRNNIDVKINGVCFSACTYLLMSSKKGTVCDKSLIGFHQSEMKTEKLSFLNKIVSVTEPLKEYSHIKMEEYGVSKSYLEAIISQTPNEDIYNLNHKTETLRYGFADSIESCNDKEMKMTRQLIKRHQNKSI